MADNVLLGTEIPVDQVPPEVVAELDRQLSAPPPPVSNEVNPLDTFDTPKLVEMASQKLFDPDEWVAQNPGDLADKAREKKLRDVTWELSKRGIIPSIKDWVTTAEHPDFVSWHSLWSLAKKGGEGIAGFAKGGLAQVEAAASPIATTFLTATGQITPKEKVQLDVKSGLERLAAMESSIVGTGASLKNLGRKIGAAISKAGETVFPSLKVEEDAQQLEHDKDEYFQNRLAAQKLSQERAEGKGPFTELIRSAAAPAVGKDIAQQELDAEKIGELAAADPLTLYLFGKGMGGVGKAVKAVPGATKALAAAKGALEEAASATAKQVIGRTAQAGGAVVEKAGAVTGAVAPLVTPAGAVAAAVSTGNPFPLLGTFTGKMTGMTPGLKAVGGFAERVGASVKGFGAEVAGAAPIEGVAARTTRAILDAAPQYVSEAAKGAGFDLFFVAGSETPAEAEAMPGMGAGFGALHGIGRAGKTWVSRQQYSPDFYRNPAKWAAQATPNPALGEFAKLHVAALKEAEAPLATKTNASLNFAKQQGVTTPIYLLPKNKGVAITALTELFMRDGRGKDAAADSAVKTYDKRGSRLEGIVMDDGTVQSVVFLNDAQFAPHEIFHGMQAILGDNGMKVIDDAIIREYRTGKLGEWNHRGAIYTRDLLPENQRADFVKQSNLDLSGTYWKGVLESKTKTPLGADKYMERELSSEAFDVLFKSGQLTGRAEGIPDTIARVLDTVLARLGQPTKPVSEGLGYGITPGVLASVKGIVEPAKPPVATVAPKKAAAPGKLPETPEARAKSSEDAQAAADELAGVRGRESEAAVLGKVAQAIAGGQGMKVDYRSAPGEPAGAVTSNRKARREIIELFRSMPESARALWEKSFFPERVTKTQGGKYQVIGWAPEVFAANAQKLAAWLAETGVKSPYEVDLATKSFTAKGWQDLYTDTAAFVENQTAGRTGAGDPLVVPAGMQEAGYAAPRRTRGAGALDQGKADFINLLFNFRLPETPRIQEGKIPLNLAGQEVSAATKPGRVEAPVRPRGEFKGEKAQALGIEGRTIQEVNPLRNQYEAEAQRLNKPVPSLIEVIQRLNLERIADAVAAPELPQFRGNTLTLSAGFMPAEGKSRAFEGDLLDETRNYKGAFGGAGTGKAYDLGIAARTPAEVEGFFQAMKESRELVTQLHKEGDLMGALRESIRSQLYREAFEAATASGSAKSLLESKPDYQAPFPELAKPTAGVGEAPVGSYMPREEGGRKSYDRLVGSAVQTKNGKIYKGFTHGNALEEAFNAGEFPQFKDWPSVSIFEIRDQFEDGFVSERGNFFNRRAAEDKAIAENLVPEADRTSYGLESFQLAQAQRAQAIIRGKLPFTEAGRLLKDAGYDWTLKSEKNRKYVQVIKDGQFIGVIEASKNKEASNKGSLTWDIDLVTVNDLQEGKGIGKALYREMLTQLQADGVVYVGGKVISPGPIAIRESIFGKGKTQAFLKDEPISIEKAMRAADITESYGASGFAPEVRNRIEPSKQFLPAKPVERYADAEKLEGNPYIRPAGAGESNKGRTLLVQVSADLMAGAASYPKAAAYYDKLYSGARAGFERMADFWEIPQWVGYAKKSFPNSDFYVVRDVASAKEFINQAGYDSVVFSLLDQNEKIVKDILTGYEGRVDMGGWGDKNLFKDQPNVRWHDSIEAWAKDAGVPHQPGVDYSFFAGSESIPRLTLSSGCKYKCAFCAVVKKIEVTPPEIVNQQADEIAKLGTKLVYLNDKTFGQAPNYQTLADVYPRIKEQNPEFQGFIVQTTATDLLKLPTEWLAKSGIKFVELGIESYNDPILRSHKKPTTTGLMDRAVDRLRQTGITLIPNIIIGFPEETAATYARTLEFLKRNQDITSHANIYNLSVMRETEFAKRLTNLKEADLNQNVLEKSFHADPEIHRVFAGDAYGLAESMLEQKFLPKETGDEKLVAPDFKSTKPIPPNVGQIADMVELWPENPPFGRKRPMEREDLEFGLRQGQQFMPAEDGKVDPRLLERERERLMDARRAAKFKTPEWAALTKKLAEVSREAEEAWQAWTPEDMQKSLEGGESFMPANQRLERAQRDFEKIRDLLSSIDGQARIELRDELGAAKWNALSPAEENKLLVERIKKIAKAAGEEVIADENGVRLAAHDELRRKLDVAEEQSRLREERGSSYMPAEDKDALQFWIDSKGKKTPAPYGHEDAAADLLTRGWKPRSEDQETIQGETYGQMFRQGYLRGVVNSSDPRSYSFNSNRGLTKQQRQMLEDLAFREKAAVYFNDGLLFDEQPGSSYMPADRKREDMRFAAVRHETGVIGTGGNHPEAMENLVRKMNSEGTWDFSFEELEGMSDKKRNRIWDSVEQGFVDRNGEFVDTATASTRAGVSTLHGEELKYMPADRNFMPAESRQNEKERLFLGTISADGEVSGKWAGASVEHGEKFFETHHEAGISGYNNFRYDPKTKTVFWWGSRDELEGVYTVEARGWLEARGYPVVKQKYLLDKWGEVKEKNEIEAHPDRSAYLPEKSKRKVDWNLKVGAGGFGKAWILPSGEPLQLKGQWHHQYLLDNPDFQERWGLKTAAIAAKNADDIQGMETDALKRGLARVNYMLNTGLLTVEARAKDWRKLKGVIEQLVERNLDKIDNMRVNLFDETATKNIDSMTTKLFDLDTDQEKLANLPFITVGEIRGGAAQYMPRKFKAPVAGEFADTLDEIRTGKLFGATVDGMGKVWKPKDDQVLLVSLASKNVLQEDLTPTLFYDALGNFSNLLDNPDVVAGVFAFDKDGKKMASIDLNAVVPVAKKELALDFAKQNNQVSVWDQAKGEEIKTGGTGDALIKSETQAQKALESLRAGKAFDFADVTHPVPEQQSLGLDVKAGDKKTYKRGDSALSLDAYAEKHRESVIPKTRDETIPSQISEAPILKGLDSEEAKVRVFADKLVEEAEMWKDNPIAKAGAEWYEEIAPAIKKAYGKLAPMFTELLAATSPQTAVPENFRYSVIGIESFKRGDYQAQILKYLEGLMGLETGKTQRLYRQDLKAGKVKNPPETPSDATYMGQWVEHYKLVPRQPNGKLYGIHSIPVLQVMARQWLTEARGLKVNQFVRNLLGLNDEATIDLWADRLLRRLGYSGLVERWRIKPQNLHAVSDADFLFSQKVFRAAADQLGMKPSALQGMMWFTEKQHWNDNGWAPLNLDSFLKEFPKLEGIKAEMKSVKAQLKLDLVEKRGKLK